MNSLIQQAMPKTVITVEDFEGLAGDQEQCSSRKAAETHSLLSEDFAKTLGENPIEKENGNPKAITYTLFVGNGKTRKNCMLGELIPSTADSLAHGKKLTEKRSKLLITKVLDTWKDFDADFHNPGAYVAWDKDNYCSQSSKPFVEAKTSNGKMKIIRKPQPIGNK